MGGKSGRKGVGSERGKTTEREGMKEKKWLSAREDEGGKKGKIRLCKARRARPQYRHRDNLGKPPTTNNGAYREKKDRRGSEKEPKTEKGYGSTKGEEGKDTGEGNAKSKTKKKQQGWV